MKPFLYANFIHAVMPISDLGPGDVTQMTRNLVQDTLRELEKIRGTRL
jgi:hypothetical protein